MKKIGFFSFGASSLFPIGFSHVRTHKHPYLHSFCYDIGHVVYNIRSLSICFYFKLSSNIAEHRQLSFFLSLFFSFIFFIFVDDYEKGSNFLLCELVWLRTYYTLSELIEALLWSFHTEAAKEMNKTDDKKRHFRDFFSPVWFGVPCVCECECVRVAEAAIVLVLDTMLNDTHLSLSGGIGTQSWDQTEVNRYLPVHIRKAVKQAGMRETRIK